jgi:hypothetical protein
MSSIYNTMLALLGAVHYPTISVYSFRGSTGDASSTLCMPQNILEKKQNNDPRNACGSVGTHNQLSARLPLTTLTSPPRLDHSPIGQLIHDKDRRFGFSVASAAGFYDRDSYPAGRTLERTPGRRTRGHRVSEHSAFAIRSSTKCDHVGRRIGDNIVGVLVCA